MPATSICANGYPVLLSDRRTFMRSMTILLHPPLPFLGGDDWQAGIREQRGLMVFMISLFAAFHERSVFHQVFARAAVLAQSFAIVRRCRRPLPGTRRRTAA